jgi:small nuclear ribonucleoprotein (snRNP)-like protein
MTILDRYPQVREVIVTTKTDKSFRGVLWEKRRGYIVLRKASLLQGRGDAIKMDGEVVIERDNVDFIQVIG